MEGAFLNPRRAQHQSHGAAADGGVRVAKDHKALLQDYLQLQKELVAKRRKLQAAKQKRDTLVHEVRFLRRRHRYLVESRSRDLKLKEGVNPQISNVPEKIVAKKKKPVVKDTTLSNRASLLVSNPLTTIEEREAEERVQTGQELMRATQKKRKSLVAGDEIPSKKKISLHDRIQLKV